MIPVSYDGNGINDGTNFESLVELDGYGLPLVDVVTARRHGAWPIVGGLKRDERRINLQVFIRGASVDTLRAQLFRWFDYEDETPKQFIVEEELGSGNDYYVMAICRGIFPDEIMPETCYHIVLVIDGDVRWREFSITTASPWSITATGQTKVVDNNGQDKAYPILKIKPTSAKSVGFDYKRFIVVKWNVAESATKYPTDIVNNALDTAALTTAKMQADGDDLRVYVDGLEVDRWLQDMDTTTTQVWCNLDFAATISMTLNGAHNNSVTTIYVNEDIANMPSSGILYIGTELITYTGKNNQERKFTGCTRGAKGTTAAAHSDTDATYWIQHDVWIYYGDSTLSAPVVDANYKPMFDLSSVNLQWIYNDFKETAKPTRPGSWQTQVRAYPIDFYGGDHGAAAEPWGEAGIHLDAYAASGYIFMGNPCGITSIGASNGDHYCDTKSNFIGSLVSNLVSGGDPEQWWTEYSIPQPSTDATWDTWSQGETLNAGSKAAGLYLSGVSDDDSYVECTYLIANLTDYPTTVIGSEQANYPLSCIITNTTTGDAIEIDFEMELNEELEVDTDGKTVTYLKYGSNQFNALDLIGGPRVNWLPLDVGNNTLQFDDVGTGNVTITVRWWERLYQ